SSSAHRRTLLSPPADTARRPSAENATPLTSPAWPVNLRVCVPVATSHSRTDPSAPPVRQRRPSGEKATPRAAPACPAKGRTGAAGAPLPAIDHRRRPPWSSPDRTLLPSGEKATDRIAYRDLFSRQRHTSRPVSTSHSRR